MLEFFFIKRQSLILSIILLLSGILSHLGAFAGGHLTRNGIDVVRIHPGGNTALLNDDTMLFTNGMMATFRAFPNDNFIFDARAVTNSANDSSHVDGYVSKLLKIPALSFTFPVGHKGKYRPCGIYDQKIGGSNNFFKAAYFKESPDTAKVITGPMSTASVQPGLRNVSKEEYWDIDGPTQVKIELEWNAASNIKAIVDTSLDLLVVVGFNKTTFRWENLGGFGKGTINGVGQIKATTSIIPNDYLGFTFAALIGPRLTIVDTTFIDTINTTKIFKPRVTGTTCYKLRFCTKSPTDTSFITPEGSLLIILPDNTIQYTPAKNLVSPPIESFCLVAIDCDSSLVSKETNIPIIILPGDNTVVIAIDDKGGLGVGQTGTTITVLANDIIIDGKPIIKDLIKISLINSRTNHGRMTVNTDKTITYTLDEPSYIGLDSFQYILCYKGVCDTAWVILLINRAPNMITPNGDGINEFLDFPDLYNFPDARVMVYNRWGDLVWLNIDEYSKDPFRGYNMSFYSLPDGAYYYVIKIAGEDQSSDKDRTGFVEIVR